MSKFACFFTRKRNDIDVTEALQNMYLSCFFSSIFVGGVPEIRAGDSVRGKNVLGNCSITFGIMAFSIDYLHRNSIL